MVYYGKEEEVETPETQLDNFRAQAGAADAVEVWAQETIVGLYDTTSALWNNAAVMYEAAVQRGDTETANKLVGIQNGLTELYKGAEHMEQGLLHTNANTKSVLEAAQALAKQKNEIETELEELVEAVSTGDYHHPQVSALIENVATDVEEMLMEGAFDEAYESAIEHIHDDVISDMFTVIRKSAPQTAYAIAERFFLTLKGEYQMNDIQRGLLASLVNTITLDDQPHDND